MGPRVRGDDKYDGGYLFTFLRSLTTALCVSTAAASPSAACVCSPRTGGADTIHAALCACGPSRAVQNPTRDHGRGRHHARVLRRARP